jgi:hypothetical protein
VQHSIRRLRVAFPFSPQVRSLEALAWVVVACCSLSSWACSSGGGPRSGDEGVTSTRDDLFTGCTKQIFDGHEYRFCTLDKSWTSAKSDCLAGGLDLVTIDTAAENAFIAENVAGAAWIGATDAQAEGVWKWTASGRQFWQGGKTGTAIGGALAAWKTGEPDDLLSQDCGRISADGKWSDEYCSGPRDYVCEGEGEVKGSPPDSNCQGAVFRGTEFWFCTNDVTWEEARDRCRTQPGVDLASVTSAEMNKFVFDRVRETSWLGGNDRKSEGEWRWAERPTDDGALFWLGDGHGKKAIGAYSAWRQTEPDDVPIEDCLEMPLLLTNGEWNDQSCFVKHGFVCKGSGDSCPADPAKSSPGVCGCGVPDKDTDGDGVKDCLDECPKDPLRVTPGTCGCVGNPAPAPAGTACSDGLCSKNTACDGAGSCGTTAQCAPHSSCTLEVFQRKAYWFCSTLLNWQGAQQKCGRVERTALVSIEDQYENGFIYRHIPPTSWIGGNDVSVEGTWRWATSTSNDGRTFWNGTIDGASPRGVYSNWEIAEPDVLADCATMDNLDRGEWESRLCGELRGFVCETCIRTTCAAEHAECGTISDGCGGTIDCTAQTGGCPAGKVCFSAAHRCSEDRGECQSKIKPDFTLPPHERLVELNKDYAACLRPGMDECQAELLARVRTDREEAAGLCFNNAIEPSVHNTIEFDRAQKKGKAPADATYACKVKNNDADHDLVPDDIDECLDTLPLAPTNDVGCDDGRRLPGPDPDAMGLARGVINRFRDPACGAMGVPSTPIPDFMSGQGVNGAPMQRNKGIIMSAVNHPPGCEMFYEVRIDALLADGTRKSYDITWAEEEATSFGYGGKNGLLAVLFQALLTDTGDRGDWSRADVTSAMYSVRAVNKSGVASEWSRFVQMGNEPRVGAWRTP